MLPSPSDIPIVYTYKTTQNFLMIHLYGNASKARPITFKSKDF